MSIIETNDFYRTVVESLGYTVRGNRIKIIDKNSEEDAEVDDKLLVLPTDEFLRNPKWATEIPFHPLCENPQRGESEVVKMVLSSAVANLNASLLATIIHLYTGVVMMSDTKKLTTEQAALLPFAPTVNDKVKKALVGMLKTVTVDDYNTSLITCNLRRRCPLAGVQYERVCVVRFPLAEMDRKETPYGLKTTTEFDTLRGMLDFILPGWETDDTYSVGTNSFAAPYFLSVMMMYCRLARRLNEVIDLYRDIVPQLGDVYMPGAERVLEMIEREGYMEKLRDSIPALDGNKGSYEVNKEAPASYRVEQPKPAVDIPWNDAPAGTATQKEAARPIVQDQSEGVAYVPGKVIPAAPVAPVGLAPIGGIGGTSGLNYDPNTFHGRQMAKQALLQPLSQQQLQHGSVGQSPFIDNGQSNVDANGRSIGTAYRPGQLQQATAQRQNVQGTVVTPSGLGF